MDTDAETYNPTFGVFFRVELHFHFFSALCFCASHLIYFSFQRMCITLDLALMAGIHAY